MAIDCTQPKEYLKQYACLACLSNTQLLQLLVIVLNDYYATIRASDAYDLPSEMGELLSDSACGTCLSDTQILQSLVAIIGYNTYGEDSTAAELSDKIQCLLCGQPGQTKAALLYLACLILEAQNQT